MCGRFTGTRRRVFKPCGMPRLSSPGVPSSVVASRRHRRPRYFVALTWMLVAAVTLILSVSAQTVLGSRTGVSTIHVRASEFKFVLSRKSAPRGRVVFVVKNVGVAIHDFKISGKRTRAIDSG